MMLESMNECLLNEVNYTEITNLDYEDVPLYKLDDLFLNFDAIPEE